MVQFGVWFGAHHAAALITSINRCNQQMQMPPIAAIEAVAGNANCQILVACVQLAQHMHCHCCTFDALHPGSAKDDHKLLQMYRLLYNEARQRENQDHYQARTSWIMQSPQQQPKRAFLPTLLHIHMLCTSMNTELQLVSKAS
jgi:hypothetical protein